MQVSSEGGDERRRTDETADEAKRKEQEKGVREKENMKAKDSSRTGGY